MRLNYWAMLFCCSWTRSVLCRTWPIPRSPPPRSPMSRWPIRYRIPSYEFFLRIQLNELFRMQRISIYDFWTISHTEPSSPSHRCYSASSKKVLSWALFFKTQESNFTDTLALVGFELQSSNACRVKMLYQLRHKKMSKFSFVSDLGVQKLFEDSSFWKLMMLNINLSLCASHFYTN